MKHWRKPRTSRSINLCRGRENKGRLCGDRRTEQRRPSWSCAEVAITDMLLGAALSRRREVTEAFLYTGNSRKNKRNRKKNKKKPTLCTLDRNKERQRKKSRRMYTEQKGKSRIRIQGFRTRHQLFLMLWYEIHGVFSIQLARFPLCFFPRQSNWETTIASQEKQTATTYMQSIGREKNRQPIG